MASFPTLPDILIHIFASDRISVTDLLEFEGVCRLWHTIIRNSQVQIWKAKLVDGFPEGCCPVLYGSENGRDVAALWRDLTNAWSESSPQTHGVRPNGQTILKLHDGDTTITIDTVFTDSASSSVTPQHLTSDIKYVRPNIVARALEENNITYHEWDTNNLIPSPPLPANCTNKIICGTRLSANKNDGIEGSFVVCSKVMSTSMYIPFRPNRRSPSLYRQLPYNTETSGLFTRLREYRALTPNAYAINETALVYCRAKTVYCAEIILVRIADDRQVSYTLQHVGREECERMEITRFNVFYVGTSRVFVFDTRLNLRRVIERTMVQDFDGRYTVSSYVRADDWGLLFQCCKQGQHMFLVMEVKFGGLRLLRGPWKLGDGRKGYYFSTMEYLVDGEGKRTGALGTPHHYWRWLDM
ncbi:hypothetical protein HDV00_008098 [Rhizophlyctis rosea]|nr:hypothetical protein HDV00_008098 [Rhizophlyctis rosea]